MENKHPDITIFDQKKLGDDDLNNIVGGTNTEDLPQHQKGDIVHIVVNQAHEHTGMVKVITLQGQIVSEPYRDFLNHWCYDVLILAQNASYDGYTSLVGETMTDITDGIISGAAGYMAENGITF